MKRVALCGIGGMGFVHYKAYKKIEGAEVVAVADPRTDMAKEKVGEDNVKVYADLAALLANEEIDMVDICTPSYLHAPLSIMAMEAGKDVICEKPMSVNSEGTAEIMAAIERTGRTFMVAHVVRFMAPYIYLKKVIDSGELGKPVHFQMKRISGVPRWSWENWMRDKKRSGGAIIDLSVHDIDYIQYVFGQPKEIKGVHFDDCNDTEYHSTDLIYEDGFVASIIGGWYNAEIPFDASFNAVFEKGNVVSYGGKVTQCGVEVNLNGADTEEDTGINIKGVDGYAEEIAYFVQCLESGAQPEMVTPVSSENAIKLAERIINEDYKL